MRCPSCGHDNPPRDPVCERCGAVINLAPAEGSAATVVGERRQITVMFSDLVDSTPLSQRMDPEDLAEVVIAYQKAATAAIAEFGGHVAQYLGDGILAYFGYPEAHEDDAERGVRAGLEILRRLSEVNQRLIDDGGVGLSVRVGIHTGPVVVGDIGDHEHPDKMIFGETPNIAARVQTAASPNSVLISESTQALLRTRFVTSDEGFRELKGVSHPMRLIRVIEPSGARGWLDWTGDRAPFVGRDEEIGRLLDRWQEVLGGRGRAVLISGEPGVGKSRLVRQFRRGLALQPHLWLECYCAPFSKASPFHPVADLIRQALAIDESESPQHKLAELRVSLQLAGFEDEGAVSLIAALLGLPPTESKEQGPADSPEVQRRRTIETFVEWTLSLCDPEPLVLCVEDLHWSDPSTLELLGLLLERGESRSLLCLLTHRPEFSAPWTGASISTIALERLSRDQSRRLARAVAAELEAASQAPLPGDAVDRLADRADGNPLYVEELVKSVAETGSAADGLDERSVPATLRDSLTARLDRLGPARRVAQLASTLGRELPLSLLADLTDESSAALQQDLNTLVESGILEPASTMGDTSYRFRHVLIQEAAYYSLLRRERRQLHARIADVLQESFPQRVESEPELLALHLRRAGKVIPAAQWYLRAGRQAAGQAAVHEAVAHYREGLSALEEATASTQRDHVELSLQILLGNALMVARGFGSPETLPVWERAAALAEEMGDVDELTSALNGSAVYLYDSGDSKAAAEQAGRILRLADEHHLRVAALRGHCTMGLARLYLGEVNAALDHARQAIRVYRPSDFDLVTYGVGSDQGVVAHGTASLALWWLGQPDSALKEARAAVDLAQVLESALSLAMARTFLAIAHHLRREADLALRAARENIEFSEQLGFPFWVGLGHMLAGAQAARLTGDRDGLEEVGRGLSILGETGSRGGAALGFAVLAETQWLVGDLDAALATLEGGLALVNALGERFTDGELLRMKAEVLAERDPASRPEAVKVLREVLTQAQERAALTIALRSAASLVQLIDEVDEKTRARSVLAEVYDQFKEGFETSDLLDAAALLPRNHKEREVGNG